MADKKKSIAIGDVFTIPLGEGVVAPAVVLFVSKDHDFLMGILSSDAVGDMATLAEVCDVVQLLLYADEEMIRGGIWPVIKQVALPETTPLTERIAGNRVKVGNEAVRSVPDKSERATYVSGSVGGQRFIENIVRQHLGLVDKQSLFMLQARDATAALLARCRKL